MTPALRVDVPRALAPLLKPARYKAAYGGRGGAKSHFFAEQVILRCFRQKTRAVCIREVQHTIRESVRQLLIDKIQALGLGKFFDVLEGEIRGHKGSLIIFRGMQSYNAENIKSLEDFDIAWVEEAQTLSERSLRLLRPTIRAEGSEIWFSWNPRHDTDAVDKFFRSGEKRDSAIVVPVNWYDNPWFPEVLKAEKDQDYADDPEMAEHVWGGGYEIVSAGAYYATKIAEAEREGRVGFFPHLPSLPVYTAWDIGVDDYTAIWFLQVRHLESEIVTPNGTVYPVGSPRIRVIDYFETDNAGPDTILPAALPEYSPDLQTRCEALEELGREHAFIYGRHFFPHDVKVREWGAGARSRVQIINELGIPIDKINRGAAQNPEERIAATRVLLPICEFHQSKRVMHGLSRLRRYSRKMNEQLGVYMGPLKDGNDHGADAFGEFAVNCGIKPERQAPPPPPAPPPGMIRPPPVPTSNPTRIRI